MESCLYTKCFLSSTRSRNYIDLLPVSSIRNWYYGHDPHNLMKLKLRPSCRLSSVKFTAKCQTTYNNGSCSTLSRRAVKAIRTSSSASKEEVEISGSMLWMVKNECRKIQFFAITGLVAYILLVPSADAVDSLKTFSCLLKECRLELAKCISNPSCAANMACLETCNNRPDETECEIKCGDLFENKVVDEFNECAVSRKRCVPQISDVGKFPVPDPSAIVKNFNFSDFTGKWYITSGLNPTFDTFDCQLHEFHVESDRLVGNLTWRIRTPDTAFFTRSAVQKFVQDPLQPGVLYNHDNEYLHYQDEWYILSSKIENKSDDYVFVYYRGRNDAWHGYGGAVIYTRSSVLPQSIVPELEGAAKSVGLDFSKFITTDNSCGPEPPIFERVERSVEGVEKAIIREVEEIKEEAKRELAIKGFRLDVDYLQ